MKNLTEMKGSLMKRLFTFLAISAGVATIVLPANIQSQFGFRQANVVYAQAPPAPPIPVTPPTQPSITITPAITALPGQWIAVKVLTLDGSIPKWVLPAGITQFDTDILPLQKNKGIVVCAQNSGTYTISAQTGKVIAGDVIISDPASCVITVGTPQPTPPGPNPTPPVVTTNNLFLLVISDSTKNTAAQTAIVTNVNYWPALSPSGIKYGFLDVSKPADATEAAAFTQWTTTTGLPSLIAMDQTGKYLDSIALPIATTGIDAEISKLTKGK